MWNEPTVTVAAAAEPLTTADAKLQIREVSSDYDALIASYVKAARAHVEAVTCTKLYTQTVSMKADSWDDLQRLPIAPMQSITSVSYVDADGATQTLATSVYESRLDGLNPHIVLKFNQVWPTIQLGSRITVVGVAGYGVANTQPENVMQAIRLLVADFWAHRESAMIGETASSIPVVATVDALLSNHRMFLI
jgi:uncharacterized phiE125 gp8 family phage protein